MLELEDLSFDLISLVFGLCGTSTILFLAGQKSLVSIFVDTFFFVGILVVHTLLELCLEDNREHDAYNEKEDKDPEGASHLKFVLSYSRYDLRFVRVDVREEAGPRAHKQV